MINKVVLVGRLTKDIELKKSPSNLSVTTFTVACNRRVAKGQEPQADFINCVAWRGSADFLAQYAKKGNLVGVEGSIQTRNYEGSDGRKVYVVEVIADNVQILERKEQPYVQGPRPQAPTPEPKTQAPASYEQPAMQWNADYTLPDIDSDDLPF